MEIQKIQLCKSQLDFLLQTPHTLGHEKSPLATTACQEVETLSTNSTTLNNDCQDANAVTTVVQTDLETANQELTNLRASKATLDRELETLHERLEGERAKLREEKATTKVGTECSNDTGEWSKANS